MAFLKAEIVAQPGRLDALLAFFRDRFFPAVEKHAGWRLHGCFVQQTGRLGTIIDLWELDDASHLSRGFAALRALPDYPDMRATLDSCIASETLVLMEAYAGRLHTRTQEI